MENASIHHFKAWNKYTAKRKPAHRAPRRLPLFRFHAQGISEQTDKQTNKERKRNTHRCQSRYDLPDGLPALISIQMYAPSAMRVYTCIACVPDERFTVAAWRAAAYRERIPAYFGVLLCMLCIRLCYPRGGNMSGSLHSPQHELKTGNERNVAIR